MVGTDAMSTRRGPSSVAKIDERTPSTLRKGEAVVAILLTVPGSDPWPEGAYNVHWSRVVGHFLRQQSTIRVELPVKERVSDYEECGYSLRKAGGPSSVGRLDPGPPANPYASARRASHAMERTGIEPVTSWLQTRRSPS